MASYTDHFDRFAFPGGYQINYMCADGEVLCADCANANADYCTDPTDRQWYVVAPYIHWEGEPIQCAHCNVEIPSEY